MRIIKPVFLLLMLTISSLACLTGQTSFANIDRAIAEKEYREALRICNQLITSEGESQEINLRLGIIHSALSNYPVALNHLLKADQTNNYDLPLGLLIAECYEALGNIEAAAAKYEELIGVDRSNLYTVNRFARMLINNRLYNDAVKWCQLLVDSVPDNPVFRKNLGGCFMQIGWDDYALPHLREAWRLNNRDLSVLASLTNVWLRLRIPNAGIETVEEAILSHSRNPIPYRSHGNLLFAMERYGNAAKSYQEAYNLGDTTMLVTRQLAFSYYGVGNYRQSIPYLTKYYLSDTANYEATYYLGIAMTSWRMKKEGIEYLEKTISLIMPDSAHLGDVYEAIGKACRDINNSTKGIEAYLDALNYSPGNPDYLLGIAQLLDAGKDFKEALLYYELYDAHQTEMIRRIAIEKEIDPDEIVVANRHRFVKNRIKKIKEELFFLGEIKRIN